MHTDELRREIAAMSDEVESFAGDVEQLHRKRRRTRLALGATAVAAIAALAIAGVVFVGSRNDGVVRISGAPSKEVAPARMTRIDAFVVPAAEAVKVALDQSPIVGQYAYIPRGIGPDSLLMEPQLRTALCALRTSDGYAVTGTSQGVDLAAGLSKVLGGKATVYDAADQLGASDVEIFLKVDAPARRSTALRAALSVDPDVRSFRFITREVAYTIFKTEFADQPSLIQSTKPSDLPESFRVILQPGRSISRFVDRYTIAPGVDTVITQDAPALWNLLKGTPTVAPGACTGS